MQFFSSLILKKPFYCMFAGARWCQAEMSDADAELLMRAICFTVKNFYLKAESEYSEKWREWDSGPRKEIIPHRFHHTDTATAHMGPPFSTFSALLRETPCVELIDADQR